MHTIRNSNCIIENQPNIIVNATNLQFTGDHESSDLNNNSFDRSETPASKINETDRSESHASDHFNLPRQAKLPDDHQQQNGVMILSNIARILTLQQDHERNHPRLTSTQSTAYRIFI